MEEYHGRQGIRYRLNENEDGGLEILQLISNPQLTQSEQQVLTQEYHAHGERVEVRANLRGFYARRLIFFQGEYSRLKEQETMRLVELAQSETQALEAANTALLEAMCAQINKFGTDSKVDVHVLRRARHRSAGLDPRCPQGRA